jgi:nucleotide-binding universal stress UspA family protein
VPIDFTEASLRALTHALPIAKGSNRSIVLLHVLKRIHPDGLIATPRKGDIRVEARRNAQRKLKALSRSKMDVDVPVECVVLNGDPEYEITRFSENSSVQLIVIGRQFRNPLSRLIFGSVTNDVIDFSRCPVLVMNCGPR